MLPGEFIINGKTSVEASSLAVMLQQWLDSPLDAKKILGSELVLQTPTATTTAASTDRFAVQAHPATGGSSTATRDTNGKRQGNKHAMMANPHFSSEESRDPAAPYDLGSASNNMHACCDAPSSNTGGTRPGYYDEASATKIDHMLMFDEATMFNDTEPAYGIDRMMDLGSAEACYDAADNTDNEAAAAILALHSVGQMSRQDAAQLLQHKGRLLLNL